MDMDTETNAKAGHNANDNKAALGFIAITIRQDLERATGAGWETLQAYKRIGDGLAEAKEVLSGEKGAFGKWCEENFQFSKEWRARLLKLAANWTKIERALDWKAQQVGGFANLGRKHFSVDGALALLAEYERHLNPPSPEEEAEREAKRQERQREREAKETEAERLRRELAEALERIRELEAEVARLRGADKGNASANGHTNGSAGRSVDAATKARAKKVWGLYTKGATDGERDAAKARLEEMAGKFGMGLDEFLAACGLSN